MEEYEVEKVIGKRFYCGQLQYRLKWKNYPQKFNSWVYAKDMHCGLLVKQFEQREHSAKTQKNKRTNTHSVRTKQKPRKMTQRKASKRLNDPIQKGRVYNLRGQKPEAKKSVGSSGNWSSSLESDNSNRYSISSFIPSSVEVDEDDDKEQKWKPKVIPSWATGEALEGALDSQFKKKLKNPFDQNEIKKMNLKEVFGKRKMKSKPRAKPVIKYASRKK